MPPPAAIRAKNPEDWGQLLLRILQFDEAAVREVAKDPAATQVGLVVVAVAGASYAIGTFNPFLLVLAPIALLAMMGVGIGVSHFIATCLGGKGQYIELFRVQGLTYALHLLSAVPLVGPWLGGVMHLVQMALLTNAVRVVHQLPLPHAIAVVVIPAIFIWAATLLAVFTVGLAMLAMFGIALSR